MFLNSLDLAGSLTRSAADSAREVATEETDEVSFDVLRQYVFFDALESCEFRQHITSAPRMSRLATDGHGCICLYQQQRIVDFTRDVGGLLILQDRWSYGDEDPRVICLMHESGGLCEPVQLSVHSRIAMKSDGCVHHLTKATAGMEIDRALNPSGQLKMDLEHLMLSLLLLLIDGPLVVQSGLANLIRLCRMVAQKTHGCGQCLGRQGDHVHRMNPKTHQHLIRETRCQFQGLPHRSLILAHGDDSSHTDIRRFRQNGLGVFELLEMAVAICDLGGLHAERHQEFCRSSRLTRLDQAVSHTVRQSSGFLCADHQVQTLNGVARGALSQVVQPSHEH